MTFSQLLQLQFIAHFLADYIFQSDSKALEKNINGFRSKYLKSHILIVFTLSWILSFQVNFIWGALTVAIFHFLTDGLKKYIGHWIRLSKYSFYIDQAIHLASIYLIVSIFCRWFEINSLIDIQLTSKNLMIILGYLVCSKPANILIKEILKTYQISNDERGVALGLELQNAGELIGTIERWLVLTFILLGQFNAIGFLLAAKSILRFKDHETIKTEYILIGSMLSFGIAIAIAVLIFNFQ